MVFGTAPVKQRVRETPKVPVMGAETRTVQAKEIPSAREMETVTALPMGMVTALPTETVTALPTGMVMALPTETVTARATQREKGMGLVLQQSEWFPPFRRRTAL